MSIIRKTKANVKLKKKKKKIKMLWSNRICVWSLAITLVQCQFQKLVGILNREIEGRNNFEILTDEEYAGMVSFGLIFR